MSEDFGHTAINGKDFHVDIWGSCPFKITVNGETFLFEDSDRFGPAQVNKKGDPTNVFFAARSPFWRGWKLWKEQGRRIAKDGKTCIWDGA